MKSDIDRWNSKYSGHEYMEEIQADPLLTDLRARLPGEGLALDIATGVGDNALYLSTLGYHTFGVDGSTVALAFAHRKAIAHKLKVAWFAADLDSYPLPTDTFDAVVVVRYLNRGLIGRIKRALRRGGVLFVKTFNDHFREQNPKFPEQYVLKPGELNRWFGDWDCWNTNDQREGGQIHSYWIGSKKR